MNGLTAKTIKDDVKITLRIEEWPEGFYVFMFKGAESAPYRDELQNTLEIAKLVGAEDFGIPEDAWVEESWSRSYR